MNENQVGVILEEVRDMFKILAEGQRIIENRLGKVEEGQKVLENGQKLLESDMKKVKSDLQIIKSFVIAADNSFNDYESRIKALEKKTANL
jgi:phosphotransferase system IIA component